MGRYYFYRVFSTFFDYWYRTAKWYRPKVKTVVNTMVDQIDLTCTLKNYFVFLIHLSENVTFNSIESGFGCKVLGRGPLFMVFLRPSEMIFSTSVVVDD